jgi:transposase
MMGKRSGQECLFSYNVNLDRRVPDNHPLRQVKERIDFSFVREAVAGSYGSKGHVSEDPEVIVKLMFLLFFDNVASERELMRQLGYRLDYLWFLGFTLDDAIPNHSILSKARARWGADVFETLFVRTVGACVAAGLVDGTKLHFDGSLVDADASNDSVVKGPPELVAQLRAAYRREELKLDDMDEGSEEGKSPPPSAYQKKNDRLVSATDPDAAVVSKGGLPPRLRYKNHRAVDDAEGVITAVATTPGDVEENAVLFDLIEASEANTGVHVGTAVADLQYGTVDNFRECGRRGIKAHMADLAQIKQKTVEQSGIFSENDFVYDPENDVYICPAGKAMARRRHKQQRQAYEYSAGSKACRSCELRDRCTRSQNGRSVKRHEDHQLIQTARAESHSPDAKRDRARRKHYAEGSFADAANNHGFKRSRWRRLWKQHIQDFLIAACQNIRILIARVRPGPKAQAQKAALGLDIAPFRSFLAAFFPPAAFARAINCFELIFDRKLAPIFGT